MTPKAFQKVAAKVHDAAITAASNVMSTAQLVCKAEMANNRQHLDMCVMYDETWH